MRAVSITVYNNQKLELFVEKLKDGFEFWGVGSINGKLLIIDHHLTHDDLEMRLEYAQSGDLIWRDAVRSEIPLEKHKNAIEMEETITRGVFWDYESRREGAYQSVTGHLGSVGFLTTDKKETASAKKAMFGRWTDGILTFGLESNNILQWSCTDKQHWFNIGAYDPAPNWWNFAKWQFVLMNDKTKIGTHVSVLRVNEKELHIEGGGHLHRFAYIFRRDGN